jgi:hypothetical protein
MRSLLTGASVILLLWSGAAQPNSVIAHRYLKDVQKIGEGVLTYLFWDIYRATLYAPGVRWSADAPFVLTLSYMQDLKGRDIAKRTIAEIRDQGYADETRLANWLSSLEKLFPDVSDGDKLTAVRDALARTIFYNGKERIGMIDDPVFTVHFFDIWLGEKSSEPTLRRALLGAQGEHPD